MNPYPNCVNVAYEYQLYRESDAQLVRSGISMNSELTLSELECNTRYRLRLRDKMTMPGADSWISVQTNALGEYTSSHSVLLCDSEEQVINEIDILKPPVSQQYLHLLFSRTIPATSGIGCCIRTQSELYLE